MTKELDDLAEAAASTGHPARVYRAAADLLAAHGPTMGYSMNYDGTEDPTRAAYVEGQFDAWSLFNSLALEHERLDADK